MCFPPDHTDTPLHQLFAFPHDVTWVRAQMISSIDGACTGADGRSGSLGTPADLEFFIHSRAAADIIIVGAGTARTEGYGPVELNKHTQQQRTNAGLQALPHLAIITTTGNVPPAIRQCPRSLFICPDTAVPQLHDHNITPEKIISLPGNVTPLAVRSALAQQGFRRQLCEGGPHILQEWLSAQAIDDLFLTTSPKLTGGTGLRIAQGPDTEHHARVGHIIISNDTVHTRWVLHKPHEL